MVLPRGKEAVEDDILVVTTIGSPTNVLAVVDCPVDLQAVNGVVRHRRHLPLLDLAHVVLGVWDHGPPPLCPGGCR